MALLAEKPHEKAPAAKRTLVESNRYMEEIGW